MRDELLKAGMNPVEHVSRIVLASVDDSIAFEYPETYRLDNVLIIFGDPLRDRTVARAHCTRVWSLADLDYGPMTDPHDRGIDRPRFFGAHTEVGFGSSLSDVEV
jgi:hypothetical protein